MSAAESPAAALFELRDVSASYGPFRAIFGVSLEVPAGKAVALLGSNGAGKTTIARVCSGLLKPTSGRLLFGGDDITGRRAYRMARLGIMHAPEALDVADEVVVVPKGAGVLRGAAADLREELGERLLPAVHGEAV